MATEFSCRACGCTMRSAKQLQPDAMVRCPKCGLVFRIGGEATPEPPKPAPPKPPAPKPAAPKPSAPPKSNAAIVSRSNDRPTASRRQADDSDRDYEDRGRPRRKKRRKAQSNSSAGMIVGLALGGIALVAVLVAGVVLLVTLTGKDKSTSPVASATAPNRPNSAGQIPNYQAGGQPGSQPGRPNGGFNQGPNQPPDDGSNAEAGGFGPMQPYAPPGTGPGVAPGRGPAYKGGRPSVPAGPGIVGPDRGGPGIVGPDTGRSPQRGGGDEEDNSEPVTLPPADSKPMEMKPLVNPSSSTKAAGDAPPAAANGVLPREILTKAKRASVYIRVAADKGVATGSGFFAAGANNMVLTNAHVVGMLQPDSPAPKDIEVILNSGESDEALFKGEVLALDRHSDLAVLKITPTAKSKDAKLPEPLKIAGGASLQETQQVFVFGFPEGELIGKNITIAQSSISSLRKTPEGELDQIQINGGIHHGNSGGPVVDAAGNVIGVAVAIIEGTTLNFAIPAERVSSILNGRLTSIYLGEPLKKSGKTTIAIEIEALDPLNRVKDLKLDWWWGAETDKAPAVYGSAPAHPAGAAARQTVVMKRAGNNRFKGDVTFTGAIPAKKVMWLQPNYANEMSANLYTQGVSMEVEPPPSYVAANLFFRPKVGRFKLKLEGHSEFNFRVKGDDDKMLNMSQNVDAEMSEEVVGLANDGAVAIKADFSSPESKITANRLLEGKTAPGSSEYAKAVESVRSTIIDLGLDLQGNIVRGRISGLNAIPKASRDDSLQLAKLLDRIMRLGSIPMPNAQGVRPGQSWQARRRLPLSGPDDDLAASTTVTYTYRGIRKIEKKSYAVVTLSMRLQGRGKEFGISGSVNGKALIDLSTGRPAKVSATVDATMGIKVELESGRRETVVARSKLDLKLTRQ